MSAFNIYIACVRNISFFFDIETFLRLRRRARDEKKAVLHSFRRFVTAPDRNARGSSLMSVWSTSTGRNTVFAAQSGGAVLPTSHLPIHVHVAHAHLRNPDGHCFHKPYHDHHCQVGTHLLPADPCRGSFSLHPLHATRS